MSIFGNVIFFQFVMIQWYHNTIKGANMKLTNLLNGVPVKKIMHSKNCNITQLTLNHNEAKKGSLFFCLVGFTHNGHDFAQSAVQNGAVAVVVEHEIANLNCVQIVVENSRSAMSFIAKNFYARACDDLTIVSLVGTNGKTSITYILNQILTTQGIKTAIIGTTGTKVGNTEINSHLTTPDPIELHYLFQQLKNLQVKVVLLEASAQAIYFHKLDGVTSKVAVFTNCTNEHLDFFKSFDFYEQTKMSFFAYPSVQHAVLNSDSATSLKIMKQFSGNVLTYGLTNPASTFAIDITTSLKGSAYVVNCNDQIFEVKTKLIGVHNVYNTLASITAASLLGVQVETMVKALNELASIPGRMNVLNLDCNNKIIIDYAHTPDGFEEVLGIVRKLRQGKLICVFGCVGYSDSLKRTEMGKVASTYCNHIVLTTDNPNFAKFETINADIKDGFVSNFTNYTEIFNRDEAIMHGFSMLTKNDTLIILGKGVETTNKIEGKEVPHNDFDCVNACIEKHYQVTKKMQAN